jgi:hypothetical protein
VKDMKKYENKCNCANCNTVIQHSFTSKDTDAYIASNPYNYECEKEIFEKDLLFDYSLNKVTSNGHFIYHVYVKDQKMFAHYNCIHEVGFK